MDPGTGVFGNHCLVISTFTTFQFPFADTDQYCHLGWLITVTFFWTGYKHVPLAPNCRFLKNPVWCGFTWKKFIVGLKMAWVQELSSGLMLLTFMTVHLFQFSFAVTEQYSHLSWLLTLTFFRTDDVHVHV